MTPTLKTLLTECRDYMNGSSVVPREFIARLDHMLTEWTDREGAIVGGATDPENFRGLCIEEVEGMCNDEHAVDNDAVLSRSPDGCHVQTWTWVSKDSAYRAWCDREGLDDQDEITNAERFDKLWDEWLTNGYD